MNKYKSAYLKAKTQKTKARIMNNAQLNLSKIEFDKFVKWQALNLAIEESMNKK